MFAIEQRMCIYLGISLLETDCKESLVWKKIYLNYLFMHNR